MTFNPSEHLITIKSKQGTAEYLPVQWRVAWFRSVCPEGTIETEEMEVDLDREFEVEAMVWNAEKRRSEKIIKRAKGYARFKATVTDGKGGRATGTKSECAANFADFCEKAESGAIGRALAALGYGTQFTDELNEIPRIVDSPVERQPSPSNGNDLVSTSFVSMRSTGTAGNGNTTNGNGSPVTPVAPTEENIDTVATEQQLASIRKMYERLGKAEPEQISTISYLGAKKLIQQLTAEYRETRQKAS